MRTFVIGSRGSQLALWQANYVAARLKEYGVDTRIEIIRTTGDHLQTASMSGLNVESGTQSGMVQSSGKGLFTKEIEEALLNGAIDLAVHSLKDLPTETPHGLAIAAIPERENPFDAIVGCKLADLTSGAVVGTSSNRRAAQLRMLRPEVTIRPIRGNVDTRLRKQKSGEFDAILLAAAGLRRLGLEHEIAEIFTPEQICPAPGQGALGIETCAEAEARGVCAVLNHAATEQAVTCERMLLAALGGGCQLPVGAFAECTAEGIKAVAIVVAPDGSSYLREAAIHDDAEALGQMLAERLLRRGASRLLAVA